MAPLGGRRRRRGWTEGGRSGGEATPCLWGNGRGEGEGMVFRFAAEGLRGQRAPQAVAEMGLGIAVGNFRRRCRPDGGVNGAKAAAMVGASIS